MKFGQLIECNMSKTFPKKSHTKCAGKSIPCFQTLRYNQRTEVFWKFLLKNEFFHKVFKINI